MMEVRVNFWEDSPLSSIFRTKLGQIGRKTK